jgi:hypothetical protein
MTEYIIGFEFVREPEDLLPEGSVVETHTHNYHHNTHLTMGLWDVFRYAPIVDADGKVTSWQELPALRVQGGGPRSIVPIPANMKHKFVLVKGWGFYRCVFAHRDVDGNYCEAPTGYRSAYV